MKSFTTRTRANSGRRLGVSVGIVVVLSALLAPAAFGAPADAKRAEAARLQRQLQAEGERVSVLDEQYNKARLRLDQSQASLTRANADLAHANAQIRALRDRMAHAAIDSYMHGGDTTAISTLLRGTGDDVVARRQYLQAAAASSRRTLDSLKAAREDLTAVRERQRLASTDARNALGDVEGTRRDVARAIAAQQNSLRKVNGELGELVKAEQSRRDAEAARRGEAAAARKGALPPIFGPAPNVSKGAAAAVAEAKRQLGKPYVYGGSGPDSFDCSGLVAWAWRAGGVSMAHSAGAQYRDFPHVPLSQLQPGDIVVFGSDLHHDGLYVGGGQMIHAPQTGDVVRYASVFARSDAYGASRPG